MVRMQIFGRPNIFEPLGSDADEPPLTLAEAKRKIAIGKR